MIYSDSHLHTNPVRGLGAREIAKKIKESGGWFITIVSLTPTHYNFDLTMDGFVKMVDLTIRECKLVRDIGLQAVCFAGIHPGMIDMLLKVYNDVNKVYDFALKALKYIVKKIREGEIFGIGEVGRQHYPINPVNLILADLILEEALLIAKDLDVIMHLHLESGGVVTVKNILRKISNIGINKRNIIIHHADVDTAKAAIKNDVMVTVLGKAQIIKELGDIRENILVESDFLDDPKRGCTAMCPWEIPSQFEILIRENIVDESDIYKIFVDNINKTYRIYEK